jgi:hypothetical protein
MLQGEVYFCCGNGTEKDGAEPLSAKASADW